MQEHCLTELIGIQGYRVTGVETLAGRGAIAACACVWNARARTTSAAAAAVASPAATTTPGRNCDTSPCGSSRPSCVFRATVSPAPTAAYRPRRWSSPMSADPGSPARWPSSSTSCAR